MNTQFQEGSESGEDSKESDCAKEVSSLVDKDESDRETEVLNLGREDSVGVI